MCAPAWARWEASMGSYKHPQVFGPLDLEIIDRVYDAAWAELEAREPFRNRERDEERREELRKLIMDSTGTGRVEFDALMRGCWPICRRSGPSSRPTPAPGSARSRG